MKVGDSLPEIVKIISQASINAYAEATGDFNPIHVDEKFAKETPFQGTIAHGFYIFGFVSELMTHHFDQRWTNGGRLDARFKKAVRPGDTIRVKATLTARERIDKFGYLVFEVVWENQLKEPVIIGKAFVREEN